MIVTESEIEIVPEVAMIVNVIEEVVVAVVVVTATIVVNASLDVVTGVNMLVLRVRYCVTIFIVSVFSNLK